MTNIFVIYKTDNWHSYPSRDLIAIATTKIKAIALCKKQSKKEHTKLDENQLFNLNNSNQTQGYSGEGEIVIEQVKKNELL